jgi:F-type H+-transporting ATPase subunit b
MEELIDSGIIWRIINFVLFVGLLVYLLRKPAKAFWEARSIKIRSEIEEAGRLLREAEEKLAQVNRSWAALESDFGKMVKAMQVDGEKQQKLLIQNAEALAQRIESESVRIADQEVRKARETLKAEAVTLAMGLAETLVRQNLGDEEQKTLADKYLTAVEGSRP